MWPGGFAQLAKQVTPSPPASRFISEPLRSRGQPNKQDQNTVSRAPQSKRCGLSHVQHTELVISSLCRARATYSRRIGPRFILDHHSGKNITDIPTVISGTAKMASSTAMQSSPIDPSGRVNEKHQGHWTWKLTYKSET